MQVQVQGILKTIASQFTVIMLSGCTAYLGTWPQTPEQFMETFEKSSLLNKVEETVIKRPYALVASDISSFSTQCIDAHRVTTAPNYKLREVGSYSDYTSRIKVIDSNSSIFSIQANQNGEKVEKLPQGGMYIFVAKIIKDGVNTKITTYRFSHPNTALGMQEWANGKKSSCPKLL